MKKEHNEDYYINRKAKLMKEFDRMYQHTRSVLSQQFDQSLIDQLYEQSQKEFVSLIPRLPYIGGKKNSNSGNLVGAVILLAIIRPLEKQGLTDHEIGRVIYDTFTSFFNSKPRIILRWMGKLMTSNFFIQKAKKRTSISLKREYPEDFVREFVEGDGKTFTFGIDYLECAICKFYQKEGAQKYLPYICLGDYPMFEALGIGLTRTTTIGHGAKKCDFRFKKGGPIRQGWPPENLAEWKAKD